MQKQRRASQRTTNGAEHRTQHGTARHSACSHHTPLTLWPSLRHKRRFTPSEVLLVSQLIRSGQLLYKWQLKQDFKIAGNGL
eukprot:6020486-Pleurochrysis_carterae.AAC.3